MHIPKYKKEKKINMKKAIIFGVTGQTGSYLAKLLIQKNYYVYGIRRRTSTFPLDTYRLEELIKPDLLKKRLFLKYGDITDEIATRSLIEEIMPDEVYNLAAQSHVKISFDLPKYTTEANVLGTLNILEAIRSLKLKKKIKMYQASTSEMFGNSGFKKVINENTKMDPVSPYAAGKLFSYHLVKIYRTAYKLHLSNGILFNHESPHRSEQFVTRKVTLGISRIYEDIIKEFSLGNINSIRDWGHAEDYALAIYKMLQLKNPVDLVICTGHHYSVRDFIKHCFKFLKIKIRFIGKNLNEKVVDNNGKVWIRINKKYFRPLDVNFLKGSYSRAKKMLNWNPKHNLKSLIRDMMLYDLNKARLEKVLKKEKNK
jgi:GDPmannose 4,6-dehydratase